jgi:hypothetical protein
MGDQAEAFSFHCTAQECQQLLGLRHSRSRCVAVAHN